MADRARRTGYGLAVWGAGVAALLAVEAARADQWFRAVRGGDVVHLPITQGAPRIERYDLAAESWLAPIPVAEEPRDVAVAPDAIYVQSPTRLRRISPAGDEVWVVPNVAEEVEVDPDGWVFTLDDRNNLVTVFDAADGRPVDQLDVAPDDTILYRARGLSIAPGIRRLFLWRSLGGIRIAAVPYDASGALGEVLLSEVVSDSSAGAFRTWVFPGEDLVTLGHGLVYDAQTLEWRDSLLGPVDELAFDGAGPIRIDDYGAVRFSPTLEPLGRYEVTDGPDVAFVHDGTLFGFANTFAPPPGSVAEVTSLVLDSIVYPPLPTPEDLVSLAHPPHAFAIDAAGTISFYWSGEVPAIHRWSVPGEAFLPAVAVRGETSEYTECPALSGILLDHRGDLRRIPSGGTAELHWRNLAGAADALACTRSHVVALTRAQGGAIATYTPDAERVDSVAIGSFGSRAWAAWSESRGRLYVSSDGFSPQGPLDAYAIDGEGRIEALTGSGGLGEPGPIFATEGPYLVMGSRAYDAETLAPGPYLGRTRGASWHGGLLFALQDETLEPRLNVRDASLELLQSTPLPGAFALFDWGGSLHAVLLENGLVSVRAIAYDDIDGDGFPTGEDAFPGDPAEWSDRDGDGTGDHGDAFPDDASESADQDGDGVGDNADPFDHDPTEWSDRDGDGYGDNRDAFPDDPAESSDSDGDGYGDHGDWRPHDASEWRDSDGDEVGDNADLFPLDPREQTDFDGDGIGDRGDPFPVGDPVVGLVDLVGKERVRFSRIGPTSRQHPGGSLGLLPDGSVSFCGPQIGCLFGRLVAADPEGRRLEIEVDPGFIPAIEPFLERELASALSSAFRRNVTLDLVPRPGDTRLVVKIDRKGRRGVFLARWRFEAHLGNVPPRYRKQRFSLTWKLKASEVVRP